MTRYVQENTALADRGACSVRRRRGGRDPLLYVQKGGEDQHLCTGGGHLQGRRITSLRCKEQRLCENAAAYLRIRLVSYYVYANGSIAGRVSSQYPTLTLQNGWIAGADHTYYYHTPVEPDAETGILCDPITLGTVELADGKTVYQVLEVFAEAIQAEPVRAVQEAWNVTVSGTKITPAS